MLLPKGGVALVDARRNLFAAIVLSARRRRGVALRSPGGDIMHLFRRLIIALVLLALMLGTPPAAASVIAFEAVGIPGISGFFQFDSIAFQQGFVPNTGILDLSIWISVIPGAAFDLGDVVTSAFT